MKSLLRLLKGLGTSQAATPSPPGPQIDDLIAVGQRLEDEGHKDRALEHFHHILTRYPQSADAHLNCGNVQSALGNKAGALVSFQRAVELDSRNAAAQLNLGNAWLNAGNLLLAEQSYRSALRIHPDWVEARIGLGCVLEGLGAMEEAAAAYRRALALKCDHEGAAFNLAILLMKMGRGDEARQTLRDCLQHAGGNLALMQKLSNFERQAGNLEQAVALLNEMARLAPENPSIQSIRLMTLNYLPNFDERATREVHMQFGSALEARIPPDHLEPRAVSDGRRLRIGYVSPDLRHHVVAWFLMPVLHHYDREAFEVFCYPIGDAPEDPVSEQIKSLTDGWRAVGTMTENSALSLHRSWTDETLAAVIQKDRIDVLVDLAGHTAGNLIALFARKPAPVQIAWLGYPESNGLSRMDFRISDAVTDPVGPDGDVAEGLLHLPDTQWCFQQQREMPSPGPLPRLERGYWTFASFNNAQKLNEQGLRAWAELLHAFPDSRLRLCNMQTLDTTAWALRIFASCGIARERIQIIGFLPNSEYFGSFREADIALDSFPYNGTTTTCETLLMGLPILGVKGKRSVSRVGESLLGSMELGDWIADSAQDLVAVAQQQLQSPEHVAQLRAALPGRMRTGVLMDAARFTRNFEAQLLRAWNARQS